MDCTQSTRKDYFHVYPYQHVWSATGVLTLICLPYIEVAELEVLLDHIKTASSPKGQVEYHHWYSYGNTEKLRYTKSYIYMFKIHLER